MQLNLPASAEDDAAGAGVLAGILRQCFGRLGSTGLGLGWPIQCQVMLVFLTAFAVSLAVTLWMIRRSRAEGHRFHDHDLSGPQKFHAAPVPRVGGIGICAGVLAGGALLWFRFSDLGLPALLLLACALPAFGSFNQGRFAHGAHAAHRHDRQCRRRTRQSLVRPAR